MARSPTGNANRTKPEQGFDDPELERVFSNTTIPLVNTTTLVPTLLPNEYSQSGLPPGAIAGAIGGGIFGGLVLLIAVFFIMRRLHHMTMMTLPKLHEMASTETQELPECALYELHDPRNVSELPSLPTELDGSVPKENRQTEPGCGP